MRANWRVGIMLAALLAGSAAADESGPAPVERVPAAYPPGAYAEARAGVVEVALDIAEDGSITSSRVLREEPPGLGFGEAALNAVAQWRFAKNRPGTYSVTINFTPDDDNDLGWLPRGLQPAPEPVRRVKPNYPPSAMYRGQGGIVVLVIAIDDDGEVTGASTYSEKPPGLGFDKAAIKAVRKWRFPGGMAGTYGLRQYFGLARTEEEYERAHQAPMAPQPEVHVVPVHPSAAAGVAGDVWLLIEIGENGRVTKARVVLEKPAHRGFGDAAEAAVRQWRFPSSTAPGTYQVFIPFAAK